MAHVERYILFLAEKTGTGNSTPTDAKPPEGTPRDAGRDASADTLWRLWREEGRRGTPGTPGHPALIYSYALLIRREDYFLLTPSEMP